MSISYVANWAKKLFFGTVLNAKSSTQNIIKLSTVKLFFNSVWWRILSLCYLASRLDLGSRFSSVQIAEIFKKVLPEEKLFVVEAMRRVSQEEPGS